MMIKGKVDSMRRSVAIVNN